MSSPMSKWMERALRLRAPISVRRDVDCAHAVGFGAVRNGHLLYFVMVGTAEASRE